MVFETSQLPLDDSAVSSLMRGALPDWYFVNTSMSRMRRHLGLLGRLPDESLIIDFLKPADVRLTEVTLCAFDDAEPGLLARVTGTLAALRLYVQTAFVHTLNSLPAALGGSEPNRRVVLDTLLVEERYYGRQRPLTPETEKRVRRELSTVLKGGSTVGELFDRNRVRIFGPLTIHDLQVGDGGRTAKGCAKITLRASDDGGVLYRATAALAALRLHIVSAQIDTVDGNADDLFFVTGPMGAALPSSELPILRGRLLAMLQSVSPTDLAAS